MSTMITMGYEPLKTIKIDFTFTGESGFGANGVPLSIAEDVAPCLNQEEFVYEVFYRITTPLTSGDAAGTYLKAGLNVDDDDCILNSTTGIIDTLNAGATGTKPVHAYTKSTINTRIIELIPEGTNDITGGTIELILIIARANIRYGGIKTIE